MAKYVLYNETHIGEVSYSDDGKTEAEVLKIVQEQNPDEKWTAIKKVPQGSHICKYCHDIAEGDYEDLLCKDCRATFGHSLYSEL